MDDLINRIERRGGARPGTGPKPDGYVKSEDLQLLDKARARKEAALADKHELDFRIQKGEYVPRSAFREASATLLANLAQTLRSIPDMLERKHGMSHEQAQAVEADIEAGLAEVRAGLLKLCGETPIPEEDA